MGIVCVESVMFQIKNEWQPTSRSLLRQYTRHGKKKKELEISARKLAKCEWLLFLKFTISLNIHWQTTVNKRISNGSLSRKQAKITHRNSQYWSRFVFSVQASVLIMTAQIKALQTLNQSLLQLKSLFKEIHISFAWFVSRKNRANKYLPVG